jgi:hypothetical protein
MSLSEYASKYAADDRGQENQRGGQEQSDGNLSSQSNEASSSRPARLTARIEFRGAQFLLRGVWGGNVQVIHWRRLSVAARIDIRPVPHRGRQLKL